MQFHAAGHFSRTGTDHFNATAGSTKSRTAGGASLGTPIYGAANPPMAAMPAALLAARRPAVSAVIPPSA